MKKSSNEFKPGDWILIDEQSDLTSGCQGLGTGVFEVVAGNQYDDHQGMIGDELNVIYVRATNHIWCISGNFKEAERPLYGYKLIKEYPLCNIKIGEILSDDNEFCRKYPEYYQPVYINEYKVGDWITITGNAIGWLTSEIGETFEIIGPKARYNGGTWWQISNAVRRKSGGLCADFRRATPKEVENAKIPHMTINGYKAEYFNTHVKFGCASIEASTFIELYKICMETDKTGNRSILSVTIGKGIFYTADIKRIADYYMKK